LRKLDNDGAINLTFGADLKSLLAVMGFSLQVNFGGFFGGNGVAAKPETPNPSPSKTTPKS
jgi:hypothetical protein